MSLQRSSAASALRIRASLMVLHMAMSRRPRSLASSIFVRCRIVPGVTGSPVVWVVNSQANPALAIPRAALSARFWVPPAGVAPAAVHLRLSGGLSGGAMDGVIPVGPGSPGTTSFLSFIPLPLFVYSLKVTKNWYGAWTTWTFCVSEHDTCAGHGSSPAPAA